jgi:acyl carrier protein
MSELQDGSPKIGTDGLPLAWGDAERHVYLRVRAFVADAADVPLDKVTPSINIFEDLKVDSLGLVLILINLEDEFNVPKGEDDSVVGEQLQTPINIVEFAVQAAGMR